MNNSTLWSRDYDYDKKIYIKSLRDVKANICGKSKRWKERKKNEFPYCQGTNRNGWMVFKARLSLHTFPSAVRSAVRSHNVKLVGLFEIISSRGDFQARDNSYRFGNTTFYKDKGRYSQVYILFFVVVKSKHTTKKWQPCWKSGLVSSHLVLVFGPDERIQINQVKLKKENKQLPFDSLQFWYNFFFFKYSK